MGIVGSADEEDHLQLPDMLEIPSELRVPVDSTVTLYMPNGRQIERNVTKDLEFSEHTVSIDTMRQASLYDFYGERVADAESQVERYNYELEKLIAKSIDELRIECVREGRKMPTDKQCEAHAKSTEAYDQLYNTFIQWKGIARRLKISLKALEHKSEMMKAFVYTKNKEIKM